MLHETKYAGRVSGGAVPRDTGGVDWLCWFGKWNSYMHAMIGNSTNDDEAMASEGGIVMEIDTDDDAIERDVEALFQGLSPRQAIVTGPSLSATVPTETGPDANDGVVGPFGNVGANGDWLDQVPTGNKVTEYQPSGGLVGPLGGAAESEPGCMVGIADGAAGGASSWMGPLTVFLTELHLQQFEAILVVNGVNVITDITFLEEDDLHSLGLLPTQAGMLMKAAAREAGRVGGGVFARRLPTVPWTSTPLPIHPQRKLAWRAVNPRWDWAWWDLMCQQCYSQGKDRGYVWCNGCDVFFCSRWCHYQHCGADRPGCWSYRYTHDRDGDDGEDGSQGEQGQGSFTPCPARSD